MENGNASLSENFKLTVPVLRQLIELYKYAEQTGQEELKIWADYSLHWAVRRLEAFLPRARVSREAARAADKMKLGDISLYKWDDQVRKSKMKDPKRQIFHYEHLYPVSQLRRDLEALNPVTDEAILKLIRKVDIAWITKEECRKLGVHGKGGDGSSHMENFKKHRIEFI